MRRIRFAFAFVTMKFIVTGTSITLFIQSHAARLPFNVGTLLSSNPGGGGGRFKYVGVLAMFGGAGLTLLAHNVSGAFLLRPYRVSLGIARGFVANLLQPNQCVFDATHLGKPPRSITRKHCR